MDAALATLHARGLAVTMSGGWDVNGHQGRFAYLDAEKQGGVAIEARETSTGATGESGTGPAPVTDATARRAGSSKSCRMVVSGGQK